MTDLIPTVSRRFVMQAGAALAAVAATRPAWGQQAPPPVVLLTGTSSGFGRLMAEGFAASGARVFASMRETAGRNAPAAEALRTFATGGPGIAVIDVDVRDEASVAAGVAEVLAHAGRIDILVSNAGIVVPGPVEVQTPEQFAANIETNALGALRLYRAVLPSMRAEGSGTIIQMSSALGRAIDPMLGGYCASKLAVEAAADALRYEVAASGIEVAVVQPAGAYPTRLQENALAAWDALVAGLDDQGRERLAAYGPHIEAMKEGLAPDPALDPAEVANAAIALAAMPIGGKPWRLVVGPYADGITPVNTAHELLQTEMISHSPVAPLFALP